MSESDSAMHPLSLSRADIKKLEKMAQKAKRDEEAKTAKIGPPSYAAVGNSVSFDAPVRVGSNNDNERRRLTSVLGRYEEMSSVIMSGKHIELMGVERQPSTPLPGKKNNKNVFSEMAKPNRPVGNKPIHDLTRHPKEVNAKVPANPKPHDTSKLAGVDNTKQKSTGSSHNSHTEVSHHHRSDRSRTDAKDSTSRGHKSNKTSVQTLPKKEHTDQRHSQKNQPHNREPVLQELGKELTKQPNSKHLPSKQQSSRVAEGAEGQAPVDPISVLQVKEENRNSQLVNGRVRQVPRIQLPEKNVEDMLKELTHVPQRVTEIQTPLKDVKFPFQDNKSTVKEQPSKDIARERQHLTKMPAMAPSKTVEVKDPTKAADETQETDDSSDTSDDDNDDSSEGEASDTDKEEGEIKSDDSQHDRPVVKEKITVEPATQQVPQQGSVAMSGVSSMPVKGQRESMSSSESSGSDSGSDSSEGSASESESDEHEQEHVPETKTTPKAKMSPDSMDPSPSRQRWALKSFFKPEPPLIHIANKTPTCEAPALDKSDPDQFDEVIEDVKRSADNISDENIPSVGQDGTNKAMSADEFSPPASVDKCVLSPIKPSQTVKSPAKRRPSAISKSLNAKGNENNSPYQHNVYDVTNNKDKKSSLSTPSPSVSVSGSGRGRKLKPKTPVLVDSSSCESESEPETNWSHSSGSIEKSIPASPQKSRTAKRDKLLKEKDSVKLKKRSAPLDASSKPKSCDKTMYKSASAQSRPQESIEKMLGSFPEETPLSPIPNVPNIICQKDLKKAGLDISPVKPVVPLNGLVQCVNGKPSVIVKLELKLFQKYLPTDFWKNKPHKPKGSLTPNEGETVKKRKLTAVKESNTSHKVLDSNFNESLDSKHTKGSVSDRSHSRDNQSYGKLNVSESVVPASGKSESVVHASGKSESVVHASGKAESVVHASGKSDSAMPDFDSLPIREASSASVHSRLSDDSSSDGSSSESEVEETRSRSPCLRLSVSIESKKRKGDDHRGDDLKRRKTSTKSPHKQPISDVHKKFDDSNWEERQESHRQRSTKRERHSSSSSQHSTHSYTSTHSRASTSSHKARRTTKPFDTQSHDDLKPLSSSTPSLSPVAKNPIKSEPPEPVKENGLAAQSSAQTPCPDSTTGKNLTDEVQHSADYYHHQAKIYKYQSDKMESGLLKHLVYLDSVLCFMQCGYTLEKDHNLVHAASMYKDTQKLVIHQCHQFRGHQDPESPELKLTVICLRIQSLVYLKLYLLKKKETLKLKKVLEDHNNKSVKSTSQPKPPSAPSPLQTTWNRSTGTPSPMSPTPSPASVGSVGSVGSDHNTPSKITNGTTGSTAIAPSGSVIVPQRIHTITQKYFANSNYLIQAHELWEQADLAITADIKEFFAQLDMECGPLTLHSSLPHLVKYVKTAINRLR